MRQVAMHQENRRRSTRRMNPPVVVALTEEEDELLSCVYYLQTPADCGDLLVHHAGGTERITPTEGQFVFFSPKLAHEVEENRSGKQRLSVAFNFGPANA